MDLKRTSRWTKKVGLGFNKESGIATYLYDSYSKLRHLTTECPVANGFKSRNTELANKKSFKKAKRNRSNNMLPSWLTEISFTISPI